MCARGCPFLNLRCSGMGSATPHCPLAVLANVRTLRCVRSTYDWSMTGLPFGYLLFAVVVITVIVLVRDPYLINGE